MGAVTYPISDISTKRAIRDLQRQLDELARGVASLKAAGGSATSQQPADISRLQAAVSSLQASAESLQTQMAAAQSSISTLQGKTLRVLTKALGAASESVATNANIDISFDFSADLAAGEKILGLAAVWPHGTFNVMAAFPVIADGAQTGVYKVGLRNYGSASPVPADAYVSVLAGKERAL